MIVFYVHFMQWIRLVPTMYPAGVFVLILTDIFCKFSNERAPKGSFESFTSMCIVSHQHQAFPVWWAKIDTESKQIVQLYKLLEYTSYQYAWWKKQIKLNTRKMHICNKKKGTKLKRTPHSYPNIHNNKHPIL